MGRAHLTAVAAAVAFGLATAIIAAQAPAAAGRTRPAQGQPARTANPPPVPRIPRLRQGQGRGGSPIQAARAAIKGANGMTGTATLYEIANGGNGHMVQIILTRRRMRLPACTACTFMGPAGAKAPTSRAPAAISIPAPQAIPIRM